MLRGMLSQSHMMFPQASFTCSVSAHHTTPHHVFWGCTWVAVLSCVLTLPETSPELAAVPLPRSETKHLVTSWAMVGGKEAALKHMWQIQSFLAKAGHISLQEARHSQGEKLGL